MKEKIIREVVKFYDLDTKRYTTNTKKIIEKINEGLENIVFYTVNGKEDYSFTSDLIGDTLKIGDKYYEVE